tara:strand:- start:1856 stop:2467 length:612 start_codon:yes stop_codon:yes gene_type:complete
MDASRIAAKRKELDHTPIDLTAVRAVVYSPTGCRYPDLENYNFSGQTNADFQIIQEGAFYYILFDGQNLSNSMPALNSTMKVYYEYSTKGDEVIADSEEIAQAVWQENTPNDIASAVWSQNSPESIQSGSAQAVWNTTIQNQNASEIMRRIYQINSGAWKLDTETRRLKFYDSDGTTVLFEFDMLDAQGNATISSVFERRPRK